MRTCGLAVLIGLMTVIASAPRSTAQESRLSATRTATLRVVVIDSVSGRPLVRAGVQAPGGLAYTDTAGRFTFNRVPLVTELRVRCPTMRRLLGPLAHKQTLNLEAVDTTVVVRLDATECIEPPIQSTRGEFRGHYTSGFESSEFRPCNGLPAPAKFFDDKWGAAWVVFSSRVSLRKVKWPKVADSSGYPTLFVRWEGTMTGPGGYGHMSLATFEFVVDRVLEIRASRPDDCR